MVPRTFALAVVAHMVFHVARSVGVGRCALARKFREHRSVWFPQRMRERIQTKAPVRHPNHYPTCTNCGRVLDGRVNHWNHSIHALNREALCVHKRDSKEPFESINR